MRTVYVVFNHRHPAQLTRLLKTLRTQDPNAQLVVHHDRFQYAHDLELPNELRATVLTEPYPILWGDFSLVDASWRAMRWVRENLEFDWLVMLSAQDYPIRPLSEVNELLSLTTFDAFVEADPIEEIDHPAPRIDAHFRYHFQYLSPARLRARRHLPGRAHVGLRTVARVGADLVNRLDVGLHCYKYPDPMPTRVGVRAKATPFTAEQPCWKGSFWAAMNHRAVSTVLDFVDTNPSFVDYFRAVALPGEAATNTILGNARDLRIDRLGLHMIRWTRADNSHPEVLGLEDFDAITSSQFLFARKFDTDVDDAIFDSLDHLITAD